MTENIRYLIYGQFIAQRLNALTQAGAGDHPTLNLKKMKTQNIKNYKDKVKEVENQEHMQKKTRYEINQFNQVKSVLSNLSFTNKSQKTLCVEIVDNVMDELRRERKIRMVLADDGIEEYIKLDFRGAREEDENISPFMRKALSGKREFKERMCQNFSILKLGYMLRVLRKVHGERATMLGADAFIIKLKKLEQQSILTRKQNFRNLKGGGPTAAAGFESQWKSIDSVAMRNKEMINNISAPVLKDINSFVDDLKQHIMKIGIEKINYFNAIFEQNEFVKLNKEGDDFQLDTLDDHFEADVK